MTEKLSKGVTKPQAENFRLSDALVKSQVKQISEAFSLAEALGIMLPGGATATLQASVRTSASGTIVLRAEVPTLGIDTQPANNVVLQPATVTDGTDIDLDITPKAPLVIKAAPPADFDPEVGF